MVAVKDDLKIANESAPIERMDSERVQVFPNSRL